MICTCNPQLCQTQVQPGKGHSKAREEIRIKMCPGIQWILHVMMSSQVLGLIGNSASTFGGKDLYTSPLALSPSLWCTTRQQQQNHLDQSRRKVLERSTTALCAPFLGTVVLSTRPYSSVLAIEEVESITRRPTIQHPFRYSDTWTGTNLTLLSLSEAVESAMGETDAHVKGKATTTETGGNRSRVQVDKGRTTVPDGTIETWNMGRWPDPILRHPAEAVNGDVWFGTDTLLRACQILQKTAVQHRAEGLAAQQCGVDARIVYVNLQASTAPQSQYPLLLRSPEDKTHAKFLMMINPSIVRRSPENEMTCWTEECLVLPRSFRATLLRDKWVDVHYWTPMGEPQQARLRGESARCFQHELGTLVDSSW
jgi:peptide deformylase